MNRLYYGDNLHVLRGEIADASVDLVYLDPPFNSNAGYNVLFKTASGAGADASIEAFDDTWTWGPAAQNALLDIASGTNRPLSVMMEAMRQGVGENPLMAYLAMMAVRLVELHRVLKPTGSLYLHCDPTASHYLKLVLDAVFGQENFRSEIAWKRTAAHSAAKRWGNVHDTIFFYTKSYPYCWNEVLLAHVEGHSERYRNTDDRGRVWADDNLTAPGVRNGFSGAEWRGLNPTAKGLHWKVSNKAVDKIVGAEAAAKMNTIEKLEVLDKDGLLHWPKQKGQELSFPRFKRVMSGGSVIQDVVTDIPPINSQAQERLGYPTQKPRALLERIIAASSNPGDVVLDPFCGCGTAVDAAEKLGRSWIGIDVTVIAIDMIEKRLRKGYPDIRFETIGLPQDLQSAERLAADDPHQFQQWVCTRTGGYPRAKKGGDKGVDGWFNYQWVDPERPGQLAVETGVISVKAGDNVNPAMVRDLGEVMRRDKHRFGLFVMKAMPTKGMRDAAAAQPMVDTQWGRFPALQIVTVAELMIGQRPQLPPLVSGTKTAVRVETRTTHQKGAQGELI
jgi:site-specific DNA-methyltransferase (adenine-specific)